MMGLSSVKSAIKRRVFPFGPRPMVIRAGPAKGVRMMLDLQSQSQRWLGVEEAEIAGFFNAHLKGCRTFVDVGANDGYYTLMALKAGVETVIACEPSAVMERLIENARLNGWAKDGRSRLERRLVGEVGGVGLDAVLAGAAEPIVVKIDVDGAELQVLESSGDRLRVDRIAWVVETHSPSLESDCLRWFRDRGCAPRVVRNAWWRALLPERRGAVQNRWLVTAGSGPR
jgi:hypothetical protein